MSADMWDGMAGGEAVTARQAVVDQKAKLEALTSSREWGMLLVFVEDQVRQRMNVIMTTPIKNMETAVEDAYERGTCHGLQLVVTFIEEGLKVAKETLDLYREEARTSLGDQQ